MKVLIVGFAQIRYMPYIYFHLNKYKNDIIHVVTWNRDGSKDIQLEEYDISKFYEFNETLHSESKYSKIFKFYKFRKFVKKIIEDETYDRIVLLHTFPAVLLADILVKNYKNQYIFDYKDITYERVKLFKKIIAKLILNSRYTLVSSRGFLKYLPECEKIYIAHNIIPSDIKKTYRVKKISSKKNLAFWGMIRDYSINISILEQIKEKDEYSLSYYGTLNETAQQLKRYVEEDNIYNVEFKGTYNNNQRKDFVSKVDFIHNMYSVSDYNMCLAMSNKFYDGIIFHIPQICTKGSLMGDLVEKYNLGISIDINKDNLCEKIEEFCKNFDYEKFDQCCDYYLNKVLVEYETIKNLD